MKLFFAYLSIALLIFSGIRAPEAHDASRGFCYSGAVLEKAADSAQDTHELRKTASNPMLLHSGFAPAAQPFDFPETPALSDAVISRFLISRDSSVLGSHILFPHDRPPIAFSQ